MAEAKIIFPKFLLTGPPGVGKTTVVIRLAALLGQKAVGFHTAELRENGRRVGFMVTTLGGQEGILAHVNFPSPHRVGKYGVDPASLGPALTEVDTTLRSGEPRYLLIDEIGKMELMVPGFKELIRRVFQSNVPLVATAPSKPLPFIHELKNRPDVTLVQVTATNRERLPVEIYHRLTATR